jgi:hypothetical protein
MSTLKCLDSIIDIRSVPLCYVAVLRKTGTVFYAKYNHQLESWFRAIVENVWWDDGVLG